MMLNYLDKLEIIVGNNKLTQMPTIRSCSNTTFDSEEASDILHQALQSEMLSADHSQKSDLRSPRSKSDRRSNAHFGHVGVGQLKLDL